VAVIIDIRELNRYCSEFNMSCETVEHLCHMSRPGDCFVSLDLTDWYYTPGMREENRYYFTVNYRGTLWRLACFPMGLSCSAYYFCKLTHVFMSYLRRPPPPTPAAAPKTRRPSKRFLRNARWRDNRLLPYMDDLMFLTDSYIAALLLRQPVESLLEQLGLLRNPKKGVWTPTKVGDHLGLTVDLNKHGEFRAPPDKLRQLTHQASFLLGRAASNARWLPARQLATFAGKAQFLCLAIAPALFFLREFHNVLAKRRGWVTRPPNASTTGRPRVVAHISHPKQGKVHPQADRDRLPPCSSDYGWGAVIKDNPDYQARGFWDARDCQHHITWKELRAVRHAIESFLPQLRGRNVLLPEDNNPVVATLTKLTTRSPVIMTKLRRMWYMLDTNDIRIRPHYIRSAANLCVDTLNRDLDIEDRQLNPRIFLHMHDRWGPLTIDSFASMRNT
jgi:hypothetical protein